MADMSETNRQRNIAIVLSAGRGSRMHTDIPKQYLDLCGKPVIVWSLEAFETFEPVSDIILVTSPEEIAYCRTEIVQAYGFQKVRSIVAGGAERYLSVWEGLKEAGRILPHGDADKNAFPNIDHESEKGIDGNKRNDADSMIFIHDGARPLVDHAILTRTLRDAEAYRACVCAMPVKDTIKIADEHGFAAKTPDRRLLWQIQTPQVFSFSLVYHAYRKLMEEGFTDVTDDAMVVERGTAVRVRLTEGSWQNLKITTPEDLAIAGLFLGSRQKD